MIASSSKLTINDVLKLYIACSLPDGICDCEHDECRYTAEHAKAHHAVTGHTYSLELSTGRIWDYRCVHHVMCVL
jgi:hypothetical protein